MNLKATRQHNRTGVPRRDEFLAVALEMFSTKGFAATSTRDICAAVGCTHSAIYNYFPTKNAILLALEEKDLQPLFAGAAELQRSMVDEPPLSRLRALLVFTLKVALEHRAGWKLYPEMLRHLPEADRVVFLGHRDQYEHLLRSVLEDTITSKAIPKQDVALAILYFFGMVDGIVRWYSPGGRLDAPSLAENAADFFLAALLKNPYSN